ncbi:helix-turn-helix domain-containing protein [Saccharopolyspora mangrovi]|uniref:helix-turn-helix domain-containing protein n=1 Tax=Saccharopolyspora mangrovi TaxID=3082379 RepID=UPI00389A05D2
MVAVHSKADVREFLSSRRARITPEQAGMTTYGGKRRVPGLRREEVAMLAGVSTEYYARLERGNLRGVSESVLDSISRALQLDEAERTHLFDLARIANAGARPRRKPHPRVTPTVQRILEGMASTPAFVQNGCLDIVAFNRLGYALYSEVFEEPARPANFARFAFFNPRSHDFYPDWDGAANTTVAQLRTAVGRDPYDKALTDLIGELCTRSEEFRSRWAAHDVRLHQSGLKHFHHPVIGAIHLAFEAMELAANPGLKLIAYSPEPGTASEDALNLLASWAATLDREDHAAVDRSEDTHAP